MKTEVQQRGETQGCLASGDQVLGKQIPQELMKSEAKYDKSIQHQNLYVILVLQVSL